MKQQFFDQTNPTPIATSLPQLANGDPSSFEVVELGHFWHNFRPTAARVPVVVEVVDLGQFWYDFFPVLFVR